MLTQEQRQNIQAVAHETLTADPQWARWMEGFVSAGVTWEQIRPVFIETLKQADGLEDLGDELAAGDRVLEEKLRFFWQSMARRVSQ